MTSFPFKNAISFDGGGVREIIVAVIMDYLQSKLPVHLNEYFDSVAGNSAGGLMSTLLRTEQTGYVDFFKENAPLIFDRKFSTKIRNTLSKIGLVNYQYGKKEFTRILEEVTQGKKLSEIKQTIFTTQNLKDGVIWVMTSDKARQNKDYDFLLSDVAIASASAFSYFERSVITSMAGNQYTLGDGGLAANNPSMIQIDEGTINNIRFDLCLSFGCGSSPTTGSFFREIGLSMAPKLINMSIYGQQQLATFHAKCRYLNTLTQVHPNFIRIEPEEANVALDDASPKSLEKLIDIGNRYIEKNQKTLDWITTIFRYTSTHH